MAALLHDAAVLHHEDDVGSRMVERRCATMKLVRPCIIRAKAAWIRTSVRVSMEEVASSRISIGGRQSITRAMQSSCFWPWLMLPPSSAMTVS